VPVDTGLLLTVVRVIRGLGEAMGGSVREGETCAVGDGLGEGLVESTA